MRIENIVLATDLSAASQRAYPFAATIARHYGAGITLVHVDETIDFGFHDAGALAEYLEQAHAARGELLDQASGLLTTQDIPVSVESAEGSPWQEVLRTADERDAGLIVVARQGLGGIKRLLIGSTTTRLLRHSSRPVLVVPTGPDEQQRPAVGGDLPALRRVIVSTDFSPDSQRGLRAALGLADRLGAQLQLTHVLRLPLLVATIPGESMVIPREELRTSLAADADEELQKIVEASGSDRLSPQLLVSFYVAEALAGELDKNADMVVVPSHGKNALRATLLGSTTEALVKLASKPVLVLPRSYLAEHYS